MRVLWFTNTSSLYEQGNHGYNGGGWISSLEELVQKEEGIELAVSFFHLTDNIKVIRNGTCYYPVLKPTGKKSLLKTLINNWSGKNESEKYISRLIDVIEDFKPDVIHVFGTEGIFGLIQKQIEIPVVIHIQGLLNPILQNYFPQGKSHKDFLFDRKFIVKNIFGKGVYFSFKRLRNQAKRELEHLKNSSFIMGRTCWDKEITRFYSPSSHYFHVDEVLRPPFYVAHTRKKNVENTIEVVSTISSSIYKGIDVILRTALLLKENTDLKINWKVIGINKDDLLLSYFEQQLNINHKDVGIECLGTKNELELIGILSESDIFVHPSYIDNSPNSICEAQLMGLPVIASHVGGIPSIIEDKNTGILVPSNGSYEIVLVLIDFSNNPEKYRLIGLNAKVCAERRHDRAKILSDLKEVYRRLTGK